MSAHATGIEMRHEVRSWLSRGYGLAPQLIMMDRSISIGAKALFCYISSIAGSTIHPDFGGPASWPSRARICADLGIGKDTFTKYLRELREAGYIRVEQRRAEGEKFAHNVYIICDIISPPSEVDKPCPKKSDTEEPCTELPDTGNADTTSNRSFTNNKESKTRQDKTNGPSRLVLSQFEVYMDRPPSHTERRTLARLEQEYGTDWLNASFAEYLVQSDLQEIAVPLRYMEGVMQNWRVEGMRLTDVLAHLKKLQEGQR